MTPRTWKLIVAAFLAAIGVGVLASEPKCTADVCKDPNWPEMTIAAPAMVLDQDVTNKVVTATVDEHLTRDESPAGDREAVHEHMNAELFAHVDVTDYD